MSSVVRFGFSSLLAFASLVLHSAPAAAAVIAGDATYMFPISFTQGSMTTIALNVTENDDGKGGPLVSGSPRPLQLIDAVSNSPLVIVTKFRNCITMTFAAPGPTSFTVDYKMADGANPGAFATDSGVITFIGSSTPTYKPPTDANCGDSQFSTIANSDTAETQVDQIKLIDVLTNDLPSAAPNHHVIFGAGPGDDDMFQTTTRSGGTATAQPDNIVQYQPPVGFVGSDSFSYILEDYAQPGFEGLNQTALVTVNVVSPPPTGPGPTDPQPPDPNAPPEEVPDALILVNGGTETALADSDSQPGETVKFEAVRAADRLPPPNVINFDWYVGKEAIPRQSGPSSKFIVALPDGQTDLRVVGRDTEGFLGMKSFSVTITAPQMQLSDLPGLQPNQMGVAKALDRMCGDGANTAPPDSLTEDQKDALARCNAIANADPASQMRALEELSAKDFNGSRTQTLLFTKSSYSGVSDRLGALRGGARGVSLQGMNVVIDGKLIPLAELQKMVGKLFGNGASADADEVGSLLGDRWGLWTRGNITIGRKAGSDSDNGFKANQFSMASGLDYRLSNDAAIGAALSFGASNVSYNPVGEGGLDTKSWALALYGTTYLLKRGYLDAVLNLANSSYESHRHINYNDSLGLIDRNAKGSTKGFTWSGGLSGGYDFTLQALTISPNASIFYTDSGIDAFRENGAGGLDLRYADQQFQSMTATLGLRINYAWKLPFGVLMPYVRSDFVRELDSKVAIFNVRFANDRDSSAEPIAVQSDAPDQSYWRLSGGLSAQLPLGFAGYIEYQRMEGFEFVDFEDFALGLRMQYRF